MTNFVTRVEIQNATEADYSTLDSMMAAANFATVMLGPAGVEYKMPTATYFSQADGSSAADVRNLALAAVRHMDRGYDIITVAGDISYFLHPSR